MNLPNYINYNLVVSKQYINTRFSLKQVVLKKKLSDVDLKKKIAKLVPEKRTTILIKNYLLQKTCWLTSKLQIGSGVMRSIYCTVLVLLNVYHTYTVHIRVLRQCVPPRCRRLYIWSAVDSSIFFYIYTYLFCIFGQKQKKKLCN